MTKYEEALKVMKQQREEAGQAFLGVMQFNVLQYYVVIDALEKQIPKKPLIWQGIKTPESPIPFDDWGYECPCCGNQEIDYPDHHCKCGQALDWREDNDTEN